VDDSTVLGSIEALVQEEHELLHRGEADQGLDAAGHARLAEVKVQLDQCWDLLRRRRALRSAGEDPETADVRSPETVERYLG
jgi:hypothetical protein